MKRFVLPQSVLENHRCERIVRSPRLLDLQGRLERGDAEQLLDSRRDLERALLRNIGGHDSGREARHVLDDRYSVAIVDETTRRDHRLDSQLVELRALLELASAHQLQPRQLHREHDECQHDEQLQQVELAVQLRLRVLRLVVFGTPAATFVRGEKSHQSFALSTRADAARRPVSRSA